MPGNSCTPDRLTVWQNLENVVITFHRLPTIPFAFTSASSLLDAYQKHQSEGDASECSAVASDCGTPTVFKDTSAHGRDPSDAIQRSWCGAISPVPPTLLCPSSFRPFPALKLLWSNRFRARQSACMRLGRRRAGVRATPKTKAWLCRSG